MKAYMELVMPSLELYMRQVSRIDPVDHIVRMKDGDGEGKRL